MTVAKLDWVDGGGVTSPLGFQAGAIGAGIKKFGPEPRLDVALLLSDRDCTAAGIFTQNKICGAPVTVSREHLAHGRVRGLVANSGNSNVATGAPGVADARQMTELAGKRFGLTAQQFAVASTGVIGRRLPMPALEGALKEIQIAADGGALFARAIMTTDTRPKECAVRFKSGDITVTVAGAAKGAGMAHPDMATVFCFVTTDAAVEERYLRTLLKEIADVSINMVDIDMDTSTSDTMLVFANGAAGNTKIDAGHPLEPQFRAAFTQVAVYLARELARDGEGAKTLIEVNVSGAASREDARAVARTISSSPLIKTMITGRDPNPGRVMMAIGRSGAAVQVERISVNIGSHCAFSGGAPSNVDLKKIKAEMDAEEVKISVDLGLGDGAATAWGCDLTEGYVRINADYTT